MPLKTRRTYRKIEEEPVEKKKDFDLKEYRKKAFAKPAPQHPEYYEGFDNCVKGIGF